MAVAKTNPGELIMEDMFKILMKKKTGKVLVSWGFFYSNYINKVKRKKDKR